MNTVYLMYAVIILLILAIIYAVSRKTKEAFSDLVYVKGDRIVDVDKMIDDMADKEVLAVRNYLLPQSEVHAGQLMPFNPTAGANNVMSVGEVASTMVGPQGSQNQQLATQNMGMGGIMNSRSPTGGPKPFDPETVGTIGAPCKNNEDCESNFCGPDNKCSLDPTKDQLDVSGEKVVEETGGETDPQPASEETGGEKSGETNQQTAAPAGVSASTKCKPREFYNTNMNPPRCGECQNCEIAKSRAADPNTIDCSSCPQYKNN